MMAVYTPKGLKIRFESASAFSLVARLAPKYTAKDVFKLTENIDSMPGALGLIAGLLCFYYQANLWNLIAIVAACRTAGIIIINTGFVLPGLATIGKLYNNFINWFLLPWVVPTVIGYFLAGWKAVLCYFLAQFIGLLFEQVIAFITGRRSYKLVGFAFTSSEKAFVLAYRMLASKVGASLSLGEEGEELNEEFWAETFEIYSQKYPNMAQQCS